jgi:hypothetical protein
MATPQQVKEYLACWFQLGKRVSVNNGTKFLYPQPVLHGDRYSPEFEKCWQLLLTGQELGDCYLEGTNQKIAELLKPNWDLIKCARCQIPIPLKVTGVEHTACVCSDMADLPNFDLPSPHLPVSSRDYLFKICSNLIKKNEE